MNKVNNKVMRSDEMSTYERETIKFICKIAICCISFYALLIYLSEM